jgi:hypothetical protein
LRKLIATLALIGTLFSGYLALSYFLSGACTLGCSFFLGYPTCLYGFLLFGLLLIFAILDHPYSRYVLATVAVLGVLFSLWFVVRELQACIFCYPLGFPNCVYGMLLYLAIAGLTIVQPERRPEMVAKPQRLKSGRRPGK